MTGELMERLRCVLHQPSDSEPTAHTARGWVDLAYEAAYGERYTAAVEAAARGLEAPGAQDPENRLMLLRILSGVNEMRGASGLAAPYMAERISLLRELGRSHQAEVEEQLGGILLREPDRVEGEILQRVAEDLRTDAPGSLILADVLSSLAVRVLHDEGPQASLPLVREACEILEAQDKPQALAGSRMFLAHSLLLSGETQEALTVAEQVMAAPANRAVRGAMAMLRATIHHHQERHEEAMEVAMASVELYAGCGVRKGAASAAALLAGMTAVLEDGEVSVLAWKVAVQQAELGEFDESRMLSLALGQQLLELQRHEEAEKILDGLSVRLAGTEEDLSTRGRALMGLGHAVTQQRRPVEAMAHWEEAAQLFVSSDELEEAVRAHLAAGALAASLERTESARTHYQEGLRLAEQSDDQDPLMLMQTLHSLGHLLTRTEDAAGLPHLEKALRIADEHGTPWQIADVTDTLARGHLALGQGTEAISAALSAADLFAEAEDDPASAEAEIFAAKVLLEMDRAEEAEAIFRMATDHRESDAELSAETLEGRIDALMQLGRADEAAELRRELTRLKRRIKP